MGDTVGITLGILLVGCAEGVILGTDEGVADGKNVGL